MVKIPILPSCSGYLSVLPTLRDGSVIGNLTQTMQAKSLTITVNRALFITALLKKNFLSLRLTEEIPKLKILGLGSRLTFKPQKLTLTILKKIVFIPSSLTFAILISITLAVDFGTN